jgi:hypothetical protein
MEVPVSSPVVSWVVFRIVIACMYYINLNLFIFVLTGSSIKILANFMIMTTAAPLMANIS